MAYPPTIADLLDGLGETHAEAGALVGLSRSHTSNIIVGRFGVSRTVVQRVLELSRAA
jgi:ParB-like chromosome segregation protein Spo0J